MDKKLNYCDIPVIIPAYEPDERLIGIIKELQGENFNNIVVVDDGSGVNYSLLFERAESMSCTVLHHAVNLGKGRALKTAFNQILFQFPQVCGVITADSDGQHSADCIKNCAIALCQNPDKLIMGCRDFVGESVPLKNRLGNKFTALVFRLFCGIKVSDTQTGLRAIPINFIKTLMVVKGEGFEFETNMLIESRISEFEIMEVPIKTIYQGENYTTHFNPLRDSLRIYSLLGKYVFSSLFSTVVDFVLFYILIKSLRSAVPSYYIFISTAVARIISAIINYIINRKLVFKSNAKATGSAVKYTLLCNVKKLVTLKK
ncbi:MAG: glycosyltransferase family 2 protein, partial [Oscillospiraceae bacterium]